MEHPNAHTQPGPQSSPAAGSVPRNIDGAVFSGIAWTATAKWSTQVLSWLSTIIVARLLTPEDYGIVAMALVVVGIVQMLSEFGIGAAIVQGRVLRQEQVARIGGFASLLGLALAAILFALGGPIAAAFGNDEVAPVVRALGLTFFITSFRTVPGALLMREMQFRRLAMLDVVDSLVLVSLTLALAWSGYGYWALVWGQIGARLAGTVATMRARPHPIAFPAPLGSIRSELSFGMDVLKAKLAWYAFSNADFAVVGRVLGANALGLYSYGWTLASIPVDRIYMLYQRVSAGVFSSLQHDPAGLRRYVLGMTEGAAAVTFPLAVGLALVAEPFVVVLLGPQWTGAVPVLRVLALASVLRSLDPLLAQLLVLTGRPKVNARIMMHAAVVLPVLFLLGTRWGLVGVAAVWLIGQPVMVLQRQLRTAMEVAAFTFSDYLRALWPAISSSLMMTGSVVGLSYTLQLQSPALRLGVLVMGGALSYTLALLGLHGARVRGLWGTIREARVKKSPAKAAVEQVDGNAP